MTVPIGQGAIGARDGNPSRLARFGKSAQNLIGGSPVGGLWVSVPWRQIIRLAMMWLGYEMIRKTPPGPTIVRDIHIPEKSLAGPCPAWLF